MKSTQADQNTYVFFFQHDSSKIEQRVIDFKNLKEENFAGQLDVAFCCLGTTLSKSSKVNFIQTKKKTVGPITHLVFFA